MLKKEARITKELEDLSVTVSLLKIWEVVVLVFLVLEVRYNLCPFGTRWNCRIGSKKACGI